MTTYTVTRFNHDFPDNDACLEAIFQLRYGDLKFCPSCGAETKFYRLKSRKTYSCLHCRYQINPLSGTIFHKSDTPLTKWFFAILLFSNSKNGVAAMELQRLLGVTYKCAWRMAKQIRLLMDETNDQLSGTVEIDETYVGGKSKLRGHVGKAIVLGMVERDGKAKAIHLPDAKGSSILPHIRDQVKPGANILSDRYNAYDSLKNMGYGHTGINHTQTFGAGKLHTNTIEGFWSQLRRSIDGTYHVVSKKYLQLYVNEFAYRYNHRGQMIYPLMIAAAARPV